MRFRTTGKPTTTGVPATLPVVRPFLRSGEDAVALDVATGRWPIEDAEQYARAGELLKGVKALRRKIEQHYESIKGPLNAARAQVLRLEKEDLAPVAEAERTIGAKMIAYEVEERERARRAAEVLRGEALARAEAEKEAAVRTLQSLASQESRPETADAYLDEAARLEVAPAWAPPPVVRPNIPATGLTTVSSFSAEVTDFEMLVVAVAAGILTRRMPNAPDLGVQSVSTEALLPNQTWLNARARELREQFSLPGVQVVKRDSLRG